MKKKIKYFIRDSLRLVFGKSIYTYVRFVITHKYLPKLKCPRSFSEKLIYRKFNTDPYEFSTYVDKFTVRQFVSREIGQEHLIPLLKAKDFIVPQDFDDLPNSFVMKTSNGGGGENVLLVEDKSLIILSDICLKFNDYLKINVGKSVDERFYDIETPKIIFEKLIKHKDGRYPSDFKVHVFNGDVENKIIIQVDSDRFGNHKRSLYSDDLKRLKFDIQPKYPPIEDNFKFPVNMDKLIEISRKLSTKFKYVRVDLYNVDGAIYFGELTFCHGSGWEPIKPKKADFALGGYWNEY